MRKGIAHMRRIHKVPMSVKAANLARFFSAMDSHQRTVGGHDDAIHLRGGD